MGLTPLEGPVMGTRCGSIDPAIVPFLMEKEGFLPTEMDTLMNRKSGLLGTSGVSNDMRDLAAAAADGNTRAQLALDMFAYTVRRYLGAYLLVLGGVDAIIMTAGIGENDATTRARIFTGLEGLGIKLDAERNLARGGERLISSDDSAIKLLVVPTNEELAIAQDVVRLTAAR
jgi:acetate kinase